MKKNLTKKKDLHYCLLVNEQATNYNPASIKKLTTQIQSNGDNYTIFEPETPFKLLNTAMKAVGVKKWHQNAPKSFSQRGKVTSLIACGGDGTVNLVSRAALKAEIPVGILPMGKFNNIVNSLHKNISIDTAIENILNGTYKKIDVGTIGDQQFFGSAALRFTPEMQKLLANTSLSRFAFRWGQNATKAVAEVATTPLVVKIDAFKFEIHPIFLNINLLSNSVGIPISPTSLIDDNHAELIVDFENNKNNIGQFVRQLYKEKYIFSNEFKIFRGQKISIQPVKGETLYLDGELLTLPDDSLEIEIESKQLNIIC